MARTDQSPGPRVFIGSTTEALDLARGVEHQLHSMGVRPISWENVFEPGHQVWGRLSAVVGTFDAAILILTPDDEVNSRGSTALAPRDNLLLELGLFAGALGPDRVFMLVPDRGEVSLPSDLAGVVYVRYRSDERSGMIAKHAVRAACLEIKGVIEDRIATSTVPEGGGASYASAFVDRSDGRSHVESWRVTTDGGLEHRYLPRNEADRADWTWSSWEPFECPWPVISVAALNGWRKDHVEVFVLTESGTMWHRWWSPRERWSKWYSMAVATRLQAAVGVSAIHKRDGRFDVYLHRADGSMDVLEYRLDRNEWQFPYGVAP